MPFQTFVNDKNPLAVEGDFASANPRAVTLAGEGGFVAGAGGVTVGRFAWVADDGKTVHNYATNTGHPDGFVHRDAQALITTYLDDASMVIPEGFPVTLMRAGDFFAKVAGSTAATKDAAVYADRSDGSINMAIPTGASATGSVGATTTASLGAGFIGTGSGTTLTVASVSGFISPGDTISGTGIPSGTTIVSQTSGTTGGAGSYVTSVATTASSGSVTAFGNIVYASSVTGYISEGDTVAGITGLTDATVVAQTSGTAGGAGLYQVSVPGTAYAASASGKTFYGDHLHITAVASGTLTIGDEVTGSGLPTGAVLATQVDGTTGGAGNYTMSTAASGYVASTTVTVVDGVATNWVAESVAAVGELVKISTYGK